MEHVAQIVYFKKNGEQGDPYPLYIGATNIGSDTNADVRLKHSSLEPVHCIIDISNKGVATLVNKSSDYPVKINGVVVRRQQLLKDYDIFEVGTTRFQYTLSMASSIKRCTLFTRSTPRGASKRISSVISITPYPKKEGRISISSGKKIDTSSKKSLISTRETKMFSTSFETQPIDNSDVRPDTRNSLRKRSKTTSKIKPQKVLGSLTSRRRLSLTVNIHQATKKPRTTISSRNVLLNDGGINSQPSSATRFSKSNKNLPVKRTPLQKQVKTPKSSSKTPKNTPKNVNRLSHSWKEVNLESEVLPNSPGLLLTSAPGRSSFSRLSKTPKQYTRKTPKSLKRLSNTTPKDISSSSKNESSYSLDRSSRTLKTPRSLNTLPRGTPKSNRKTRTSLASRSANELSLLKSTLPEFVRDSPNIMANSPQLSKAGFTKRLSKSSNKESLGHISSRTDQSTSTNDTDDEQLLYSPLSENSFGIRQFYDKNSSSVNRSVTKNASSNSLIADGAKLDSSSNRNTSNRVSKLLSLSNAEDAAATDESRLSISHKPELLHTSNPDIASPRSLVSEFSVRSSGRVRKISSKFHDSIYSLISDASIIKTPQEVSHKQESRISNILSTPDLENRKTHASFITPESTRKYETKRSVSFMESTPIPKSSARKISSRDSLICLMHDSNLEDGKTPNKKGGNLSRSSRLSTKRQSSRMEAITKSNFNSVVTSDVSDVENTGVNKSTASNRLTHNGSKISYLLSPIDSLIVNVDSDVSIAGKSPNYKRTSLRNSKTLDLRGSQKKTSISMTDKSMRFHDEIINDSDHRLLQTPKTPVSGNSQKNLLDSDDIINQKERRSSRATPVAGSSQKKSKISDSEVSLKVDDTYQKELATTSKTPTLESSQKTLKTSMTEEGLLQSTGLSQMERSSRRYSKTPSFNMTGDILELADNVDSQNKRRSTRISKTPGSSQKELQKLNITVESNIATPTERKSMRISRTPVSGGLQNKSLEVRITKASPQVSAVGETRVRRSSYVSKTPISESSQEASIKYDCNTFTTPENNISIVELSPGGRISSYSSKTPVSGSSQRKSSGKYAESLGFTTPENNISFVDLSTGGRKSSLYKSKNLTMGSTQNKSNANYNDSVNFTTPENNISIVELSTGDFTPSSPLKTRKSKSFLHIDSDANTTPKNIIEQDEGFKTPLTTPAVFESLRKSVLRSKKRLTNSIVKSIKLSDDENELFDDKSSESSAAKAEPAIDRKATRRSSKSVGLVPDVVPNNQGAFRGVKRGRESTGSVLKSTKKMKRIHSPENQRKERLNFDSSSSELVSETSLNSLSELDSINLQSNASISSADLSEIVSEPVEDQFSENIYDNNDITISKTSSVNRSLRTRKSSLSTGTKRSLSMNASKLSNISFDMSGIKGLMQTPEQLGTSSSNLSSAKKRLKTPRKISSPLNDLTDVKVVKKVLRTPKPVRSPANDLSDVRGIKKLLKTPMEHKSPLNDLSNVHGMKKLFRTPKEQKSPKNNLTDIRGIKKLLKTPKQQKSPKNDLTNVHGLKKLLRTPKNQKSPKNDLRNIIGIKTLLKTPRQQRAPKNDLTDVTGVKRLMTSLKIQRSPINDLTDVRGVKQLLRTPRIQNPPSNDLTDVRGVKNLLGSPRNQRPPKNDLRDVRGVKVLLASPRVQKPPKNDLSDVRGVKVLLGSPIVQRTPKNDLTDVDGVKELFGDRSDIENVDLFSSLHKKPLRTYRAKTLSPNKCSEILKGIRRTLGDIPINSPHIEKWVEEQMKYTSLVTKDSGRLRELQVQVQNLLIDRNQMSIDGESLVQESDNGIADKYVAEDLKSSMTSDSQVRTTRRGRKPKKEGESVVLVNENKRLDAQDMPLFDTSEDKNIPHSSKDHIQDTCETPGNRSKVNKEESSVSSLRTRRARLLTSQDDVSDIETPTRSLRGRKKVPEQGMPKDNSDDGKTPIKPLRGRKKQKEQEVLKESSDANETPNEKPLRKTRRGGADSSEETKKSGKGLEQAERQSDDQKGTGQVEKEFIRPTRKGRGNKKVEIFEQQEVKPQSTEVPNTPDETETKISRSGRNTRGRKKIAMTEQLENPEELAHKQIENEGGNRPRRGRAKNAVISEDTESHSNEIKSQNTAGQIVTDDKRPTRRGRGKKVDSTELKESNSEHVQNIDDQMEINDNKRTRRGQQKKTIDTVQQTESEFGGLSSGKIEEAGDDTNTDVGKRLRRARAKKNSDTAVPTELKETRMEKIQKSPDQTGIRGGRPTRNTRRKKISDSDEQTEPEKEKKSNKAQGKRNIKAAPQVENNEPSIVLQHSFDEVQTEGNRLTKNGKTEIPSRRGRRKVQFTEEKENNIEENLPAKRTRGKKVLENTDAASNVEPKSKTVSNQDPIRKSARRRK